MERWKKANKRILRSQAFEGVKKKIPLTTWMCGRVIDTDTFEETNKRKSVRSPSTPLTRPSVDKGSDRKTQSL